MSIILPQESFFSNAWNTTKGAIKNVVIFNSYLADKAAQSAANQLAAQRGFEEARLNMELTKLKAQALRDMENRTWQCSENWIAREFSKQENEKNRLHQQELAAYTKQWDYKMQHERMDFELLLQQERKAIDLEMQQNNYSIQIALSLLGAINARDTDEYRRLLNNFPLRTSPSVLIKGVEEKNANGDRIPFLVTISPPIIDFDPHQIKQEGAFIQETPLNEAMRNFLWKHYPKNDSERPTEFIGSLWESNKYRSEAAIKNLHYLIPVVPTLVINSEIQGEFLNLHAGVWVAGKEWVFIPIMSNFDVYKFISAIAKHEAIEWHTEREELIKQKFDAKRLTEIYGNKEINWQLLQEELQIRKTDSDFIHKYRPTKESLKTLEKYLAVLHQVVACLMIDKYFLYKYQTPPKLPSILPELLKNIELGEQKFIVDLVVEHCGALCQDMDNKHQQSEDLCHFAGDLEQPILPDLACEISFELAFSLLRVNNFESAIDHFTASIRSFLLKHNEDEGLLGNIKQLKLTLSLKDKNYFSRLEQFVSSFQSLKTESAQDGSVLQAWIHSIECFNHLGRNVITEILDNKYQQIQKHYDDWLSIQIQIKKLLEQQAEQSKSKDARSQILHDTERVTKQDLLLQESITTFKHEIDNPLITIATSGTTSSGKSSLVNLLCGAPIMPVAVQEMSAGTVVIDHHPTNRTLKIPHTDGIPTEYTGEWFDISDDDIASRLKNIMNYYRQLREENREPPAPRFELQYPTRIGLNPEKTGLPAGFRLRIIDLPGLKYIADEHNRDVIRQEIKPALCLVTYNSEETDPKKQDALLEQVVEQVREMRGSPARMLFVLNRIDAFLRDGDGNVQAKNFVAKIQRSICKKIADNLPEYREQAEKLKAQPLSTAPALYAHQILTSEVDGVVIQAITAIDKTYNKLIAQDVIEELPRKTSQWSVDERKQVAEFVWSSSYGKELDQTLSAHIQQNIPQLLLPHLLKAVTDSSSKALEVAHLIVHTKIHATNENYQKECDRLSRIGADLKNLRTSFEKDMLAALNQLKPAEVGKAAIVGILIDVANQLQVAYKLPEGSLAPFYDWTFQLGKSIESFMSSIADSIVGGITRPKDECISSLSPVERQAISDTLALFKASEYHRFVKEGGIFEAEQDSSEAEALAKINQALNKLSEVIANSMSSILAQVAEREIGRVQDTFEMLMAHYTKLLGKNAQNIAGDIQALAITPSKLVRINKPLILHIRLKAGFSTKETKRKVAVGEEEVIVGTRLVKTGEKRLWYTLWLAKENIYEEQDVYETRTIYEKRHFDVAVIPSLHDVLGDFIYQAKESRTEAEFVRWFNEQIHEFLSGIAKYQEDLLVEYRDRLDTMMKYASQEKELEIGKWQPIETQVRSLQQQLESLNEVQHGIVLQR